MIEDLLNPLGISADIDKKIYEYQNIESEIMKIIKDTIRTIFSKNSLQRIVHLLNVLWFIS